MKFLFNILPRRDKLRETFLDAAAYERLIEDLAVDSSARLARGGIALQLGDVLTETQFQDQMAQLKKEVDSHRGR